MHAHWAVWRLGQRFPSDTLARIRSAIPAASVGLRCALVTQFAMLPETEGIVPAACELLEGFDKFAASEPAPFLLFATVECLRVVGRDSEAGELLARYEPMLPERGRKSLREMIESPEWHLSQGVRELEHLDIEDICVRGAMLDVAGEDAEEEEPAPEPPPVKPGRNDPCWCGSGKKYKKCHLAEDETGEARHREPEAEPPAGDPMWTKLFNDVLLSARDRHSRAEFREANLLYFDQHPSDVDSQSPAMPGFFEWYVHDFRPRGDGRTLVEDYYTGGDGSPGTRFAGPDRGRRMPGRG